MSCLTDDQLKILEQREIADIVNDGFLKERLRFFVSDHNLTDSNYECQLFYESKLIKKLKELMECFVLDEVVIIKTTLTKALTTNYEKIKSWVDNALKDNKVTSRTISATEHWDYCIMTLALLIGIRIVEKILNVN